jgi:hypothetical protein
MKEENSVTKNWFKDWSDEYDSTLGKVNRHHKLLDLNVGVVITNSSSLLSFCEVISL